MPARKKKTSNQVGVGMTAKQLRRKKPYNADMMIPIEALTENCLLYTSPSPRD